MTRRAPWQSLSPKAKEALAFIRANQKVARQMDKARPCAECGTNWADPPSTLCPGCEAYREHQR